MPARLTHPTPAWMLLLTACATIAADSPDPSAKNTPAPSSQLLEHGSFERPSVQSRTPVARGANPSLFGGRDTWSLLTHPRPQADGGSITTGLTNETARTGRQSLYVRFDKFTARNAGATLATALLPIQPGKPYHLGIFGKIDRKDPLTLVQRQPFLKLLVEFYQTDRETPTGTPVIRTHPLPDHRVRIANRPLLFNTESWNEFGVELRSPEDAAYLKATWKWETNHAEGVTTGVIYFDDAILIGEPVPQKPSTAQAP